MTHGPLAGPSALSAWPRDAPRPPGRLSNSPAVRAERPGTLTRLHTLIAAQDKSPPPPPHPSRLPGRGHPARCRAATQRALLARRRRRRRGGGGGGGSRGLSWRGRAAAPSTRPSAWKTTASNPIAASAFIAVDPVVALTGQQQQFADFAYHGQVLPDHPPPAPCSASVTTYLQAKRQFIYSPP